MLAANVGLCDAYYVINFLSVAADAAAQRISNGYAI